MNLIMVQGNMINNVVKWLFWDQNNVIEISMLLMLMLISVFV